MRLIDADEFKAFNARWMANEKDPDKKRARETRTQLFNTFIDMQETIDAIPVVRCKDCKHSEHWYGDKCLCYLWNETGIDIFENGYCSYGERKQDHETD